MNPEQFFYKVKEMRDAQKEYFKYRTKSALEKSKKLESRTRKALFKKYPPRFVAVYSERQKCAKMGDFKRYCKNSNTQTYAWFVFEKGFVGNPQITWI